MHSLYLTHHKMFSFEDRGETNRKHFNAANIVSCREDLSYARIVSKRVIV